MIKVKVNDSFPITVTLIDEELAAIAPGKTVYYDIRQRPGDTELTPPVNGVLTESTAEPGIYNTMVSLDTAGNYIVYITCTGFASNAEDIVIYDYDEEDVLTSVYANRHYNISIEDVVRTSSTPTVSQATRNVPYGSTDYVITKIKRDTDADWGDPVAQGNVYAWYNSTDDIAPYKMGGSE